MANTLFTLVFIIIYFNGCFGSNHIFLQVAQNGTNSPVYKSDVHKYFIVGETVIITCNVDKDLVDNEGHGSHISFIRDDVVVEHLDNYKITYPLILQEGDDGLALQCKATSDVIPGSWTITVHFEMIKNDNENGILTGKPNVFKILLISLGAFLLGSLFLLVCYSIISKMLKKNRKEDDFDDVPLDKNKDTYATIDPSQKTKNRIQPSSEDVQYTEIGFVNQSCVQDANATDFTTTLNDKLKDSRVISYPNTYVNFRHGSSDC